MDVRAYGFNDRIGDEFKKEDLHFAVAKRFSTSKRDYPRVYRGNNGTGLPILSYQQFMEHFDSTLNNDLKESLNVFAKKYGIYVQERSQKVS